MFVGIGVGINRRRFRGGFAGSYFNRVLSDGGIIESSGCVTNVSALLKSATFLFIPSGIKLGLAYSALPNNGNGDLTWTRGSSATRTLSNGTVELPRTNFLINSVFNGAAIGNPGTLPTGYNVGNSGGLSREVVGLGVENGLNYIDLRLSGTATFTVSTLNLSNLTSSLTGQTWTHSLYVKAINSSPDAIRLVQVEFNSSSVYVTEGASPNFFPDANLQRYVYTRTTNGGVTTDRVSTALYFGITIGQSYDFTVRIAAPQMEQGAFVSEYIPTTNSERTVFSRVGQSGTGATNIPRLSYMYGSCPAALLEPQRTNSLVNSELDGAVVGNPGTLPTGYTVGIPGGLSREVVGLGIENGLTYIDLKLSGVAGAGGLTTFDLSGSASAANGQTWTHSLYAKAISSYPNSIQLRQIELTSAGSYVTEGGSVISVDSTLKRHSLTRTLNGGVTVGRVLTNLYFFTTPGQSYDFTIRIAAPQMEQGAFTTTYIPTRSTSATRNIDRFTRDNIRTNGLIGSTSGTWYVELRNNIQYVRDAATFPLFISSTSTSGASSNSIEFRVASGTSSRLAILKRISGTGTPLFTTTANTIKVAVKWNSTRLFLWVNGSEISLTGGTETFAVNNFEFLNGFGTDIPLFIQAMALFNTALSDADCQTLTT